jgi:tRNA-specific 2-thiouridylase
MQCEVRHRHRAPLVECTVTANDKGIVSAEFEFPQRAITPGQYAVFYEGLVCLGGGIIQGPGPSYHATKKQLPKSLNMFS